MLPFVNNLLAWSGTLRDSLGNSVGLASPRGRRVLSERPNAKWLRQISGLRGVTGSEDDPMSDGRGALLWAG
jgi:hypothetical protein